jgi:alkylation response protein AidB-like acyl-CoA dehydrogenase
VEAQQTRYVPSAEQVALAGTIEKSLAALLPRARLHVSAEEDADTWTSLDEIGIFSISTSEEQGGSGLGATDEALIVIELGRHLASPAVLATLGASHAPPSANTAAIRGRRVAAAYRRGDRVVLIENAATDLVLLRDQSGAALYESGTQPSKAIDDRLWIAKLREAALPDQPLVRFGPSEVLRLRLIDAAALAGIAATALEMSVAYAGLREQFGRPIGSFQAVKHHCANMAMAARCARDQTSFAAVALDEGRSDAVLQIECALFVAGTAALDNAAKNIQIHGGIGFSEEADPHLVLKRAQILIAIAGGLEAANWRIANTKVGW